MDVKSRLVLMVIYLLSLLSLKGARRLGRFIGWFLRVSNGTMYKVTRKNIELCYPDLDEAARERFVRDSLFHTGCQIAETGLAWGGDPEQRAKAVSFVKKERNPEVFDDALAKGKGVIMLAPHFGNWEFFAHFLPQKCDLMAMYKPARMPVMEQRMLESRSQGGVKMVSAGREGVINFIKHYRKGGACFILPDQEPPSKSGIWSSYFGVPALTPKFVHYMIKKNPEGTVILAHMKRTEEGFEIIYSNVDDAMYDADMETSVTAMNRTFERCINKDGAEQYQWDYKRFKKNPEKFYRNL